MTGDEEEIRAISRSDRMGIGRHWGLWSLDWNGSWTMLLWVLLLGR